MNPVVVGVDHSAGGQEAVRFPREEAALRKARLRSDHRARRHGDAVVLAEILRRGMRA
jgi:hypothetical protein